MTRVLPIGPNLFIFMKLFDKINCHMIGLHSAVPSRVGALVLEIPYLPLQTVTMRKNTGCRQTLSSRVNPLFGIKWHRNRCKNTIRKNINTYHWRIQGGRQGRVSPPGSKFFHFHAVFGKKLKNNSTFGSRRIPLGKILDPPLFIYRK